MNDSNHSIEGQFGKWQMVMTKDGPTLWSARFDETCHSADGSRGETDLYYVQGCKVVERAPLITPFSLFEMGFGLGLGYERTVEALHRAYPSSPPQIFYLAIEREEQIIRWGQDHYPAEGPHPYPQRFELKPCKWNGIKALQAWTPQGALVVLLGEARELMKDLIQLKQKNPSCIPSFWAIYQDAFSPRKNPELWTVEWFSELQQLAAPSCLLSTFSASSRIRKSLLAAHWKVRLGERFGPKRASTVASLEGESCPFLLERLQRSPVELLSDANLSEWK